MKRILPFILPSIGSLILVLVFLGAVIKGPQMLNIDGDLGRHLVIGGYILEHHSIPLKDLFSHTMLGADLTPHEWLAQVIFAGFYRLLGLSGPVLLTALLVAAAIYLSFLEAFKRSESLLAGMVITLLAIGASSLHWLTRPHVFTFLFLVVWYMGLERIRRGNTKGWFWLPVWMAIWANLHGAFIAGFMVWALIGIGYLWEHWFERDRLPTFAPQFGRTFLLVGGLSALATLINPAGVRLWITSIGYIGNSYLVGHTAEYLSPDFHSPSTLPFLLMILLGLFLFGLSSKRRAAVDVILFSAWAAMGLFSMRNIPLFALLSVPVLAEAGRGVMDVLGLRGRFWGALLRLDGRLAATERSLRGLVWPALVMVLVIAGLAGGAGGTNQFNPATFPVAAVDWLERHPQKGEMFNYFPWGGYLLYREWPNLRVFIDGQTDFYGESLTRTYEQVLTAGDGWQAVLDRYQVGWVILPPGEALVHELGRLPGWETVYQDQTAVILSRR